MSIPVCFYTEHLCVSLVNLQEIPSRSTRSTGSSQWSVSPTSSTPPPSGWTARNWAAARRRLSLAPSPTTLAPPPLSAPRQPQSHLFTLTTTPSPLPWAHSWWVETPQLTSLTLPSPQKWVITFNHTFTLCFVYHSISLLIWTVLCLCLLFYGRTVNIYTYNIIYNYIYMYTFEVMCNIRKRKDLRKQSFCSSPQCIN